MFNFFLVIFFIKINIEAMDRDDARKTAINAMYYALEEYYYPKYGYYPSEINEEVLPVIDPELFTDPFGTNLGIDGSSYSYESQIVMIKSMPRIHTRAELREGEVSSLKE